ncbi:hypothetical protein [Okeania sp. SIO2B3]|uniref:hypothetical protein n=1 Tax=Okeania sp. SIO2B3 TaxID=2607784 RepID=UPI0013BF45B0|nr:hypothetical protein [Okeania sp. SIO2B3]NET41655.1 hypothetical protein [Okeania sp. SIO2B3]
MGGGGGAIACRIFLWDDWYLWGRMPFVPTWFMRSLLRPLGLIVFGCRLGRWLLCLSWFFCGWLVLGEGAIACCIFLWNDWYLWGRMPFAPTWLFGRRYL